MPAYLLLLVAVLSRVIPHADWYGFSAMGGALLYFGARRRWVEMIVPVAVLAVVDFYLTTRVYSTEFHAVDYLTTWAWYAAAMALGHILLRQRTTLLRGVAAALLGPTSFFLATNFAVWAGSHMYAPNTGGLVTCYLAGVPFYTRDLVSTAMVVAVAFGAPVMLRRLRTADDDAETLRP